MNNEQRSMYKSVRYQGCIQDLFMGGGGGAHTLVQLLGGLVASSPRIILYSMLDSDLILGGGRGGLKLEGGNSSAPPSLLCMQPWLFGDDTTGVGENTATYIHIDTKNKVP